MIGYILSNAEEALEFSDEKNVTIQSRNLSRDYWGIEIGNSGPSIPIEVQERIFEPFYKHEKEVGKGVGLGLAVAKANCEKNNGLIRLLNHRPVVFQIVLPRMAPEKMDDMTPQQVLHLLEAS